VKTGRAGHDPALPLATGRWEEAEELSGLLPAVLGEYLPVVVDRALWVDQLVVRSDPADDLAAGMAEGREVGIARSDHAVELGHRLLEELEELGVGHRPPVEVRVACQPVDEVVQRDDERSGRRHAAAGQGEI
jgi:hypothetical protein